MSNLLWLLLPIAAMSGWYVARREYQKKIVHIRTHPPASDDYYKGLNYLLNEQPDKALDHFLKVVEIDKDTLELHLALGSLFRKRGEVDRAIRIHQELLNRFGLSQAGYAQTLLELAQDYMSAGLLDRTESLCLELIDVDASNDVALILLYEIYQREKEWFRAIDIARKLELVTAESRGAEIAHFYCELSTESIDADENTQAIRFLDKALVADSNCGRAIIARGWIAESEGRYQDAIDDYYLLGERAPLLLIEALPSMHRCYQQHGDVEAMLDYLKAQVDRGQGIDLVLETSRLLVEIYNEDSAAEFLRLQLDKKPSLKGVRRLVQLSANGAEQAPGLSLVIPLIDKLLEEKPAYICQNCGFSGKVIHWHCPSCKCWGTVGPVQEFRWGVSS